MLDFLTDNPFLIIILIGVLSSLFGREKKKEESRRTQHRQGPAQTTHRTGPSTGQHHRADTRKNQPHSSHSPRTSGKMEQARTTLKQAAEKKIEQARQMAETYTHKAPAPKAEEVKEVFHDEMEDLQQKLRVYEEKLARSESISASIRVQKDASDGRFSQNQLVNGIVMSEILGPPRAKKPYHKMK
ncbi:hypothetical protein [Bacillus sp. 1P06AnD]|uniref:hypothetical protein n=1 Tax=Bacillus sp. 1P06AnD TaxID=3132208 RepID=UPI0039A1A181